MSARYIEEAVEASLRRLQTDVIDLYLSHFPDMATPFSETLGAYQKLIEKGKIRWCGASNLTVALLEAAIAVAKAHGLPRYEVLQPEYNLVDRAGFEGGLADICRREEIGVITYFSLAKGFLSGKYRSDADLTKSPRGGGVKGYLNPRGFRILDALGGRRLAPQGEAGRGRPRLGDRAAGSDGADRQRHDGRTGRQPHPRDRAFAVGGGHGGADTRRARPELAIRPARVSVTGLSARPSRAVRGAESFRSACAAGFRETRRGAASCIRSDTAGSGR